MTEAPPPRPDFAASENLARPVGTSRWTPGDALLVFLAAAGGLNVWRVILFAIHTPARITAAFWIAGSSAILFGIALAGAKRFGRGHLLRLLRFRRPSMIDIGVGIVTGLALYFATKWIQNVINTQLAAWVRLYSLTTPVVDLSQGPWLVIGLLQILIVPVGEEAVFRGFVYAGLRTRHSILGATTFSALLFALVHLNPAVMPAIFLDGVVLALAFEWRDSLALPMVVHASVLGCFFLESIL